MRRREVIAGLGVGLVSRAISARAQTGRPRILWLSTEAQPDPFVEGFREGLRNHGYVDGQNVDIDLHYAPGNPGALQAAVGNLIRTKPDLCVERACHSSVAAPERRAGPVRDQRRSGRARNSAKPLRRVQL